MFIRKGLYKNFKILYRLSHWLKFRFTANGWLVLFILIISGIFSIDTRQTLAFQIFSICFSLLLVATMHILTFRGKFIITRQLPAHGCSGETVFYRCHIDNQLPDSCRNLFFIDTLARRFPTFAEYMHSRDPHDRNRNIFDRYIGYPRLVTLIQMNCGGIIRPGHIDYIAARGKVSINLKLVPLRRGYLYFHQFGIARTDPLGLIRSFKIYDAYDKLLILPKLYRAPSIPFKNRRLFQPGGISLASSIGESNEFMSLRDYRPGDPLRSIHWRSYAKRTQPVVKEYQDEYFSRLGLILDTFCERGSAMVFEEAVSVVSSFITSMQRQDCLLDLLFVGADAFHCTSGRGLADTAAMLETLACVEPCEQYSFSELTNLVDRNINKFNSLICVLLDLSEDRRAWLQRLAQSNTPAICLIIHDDNASLDNIERYRTQQLHIHTFKVGNLQEQLDALEGVTPHST